MMIAGVGVGGVLYVLGRSAAKRPERITLSPVVAPNQVGWAVAGSF